MNTIVVFQTSDVSRAPTLLIDLVREDSLQDEMGM